MTQSFGDLRNGVVLAELGGHGDGPYCAKHGAGAALVMLGTYVVAPGLAVPYPAHFTFKPGRRNYASYLGEHVGAARAGGAKVGISVISVALSDSVDFLVAAEEAGADYASLCAHSKMEMFTREGLGTALCRPENRDRLTEWAGAIVRAVKIPVIFKIRGSRPDEVSAALEILAGAGVHIVHANVGTSEIGSPGLRAVASLAGILSAQTTARLMHDKKLPEDRQFLRGKCGFGSAVAPLSLIAGGGVSDVEGARRVLNAGADAVAIGSAAMKDPALCGRIQSALRPA